MKMNFGKLVSLVITCTAKRMSLQLFTTGLEFAWLKVYIFLGLTDPSSLATTFLAYICHCIHLMALLLVGGTSFRRGVCPARKYFATVIAQ